MPNNGHDNNHNNNKTHGPEIRPSQSSGQRTKKTMFAENNSNNNGSKENDNDNGNSSGFWGTMLPSNLRETLSQSLGFFAVIDAAWHVTVFAACYRYRPLHKFLQTPMGQRWRHRFQKGGYDVWNKDKHQNSRERCQQWVQRYVPGGQRSMVAASEWFVINKTIGLPLLPTRLLLAKWMSEKWKDSPPSSWNISLNPNSNVVKNEAVRTAEEKD